MEGRAPHALRRLSARTAFATDGHPFWLPELREWVPASAVRAGDLLQTSAGTGVQVVSVRAWTASRRVHNLTVDELHTYHVLAGNQAILVHNSGPCDPVDASTPIGSRGNKLEIISPNKPGVIDGRQYSGHALDRMQQQGIMPSVVENAIRGRAIPGKRSGTTAYYDDVNDLAVITDTATGRVITVDYGRIRQ